MAGGGRQPLPAVGPRRPGYWIRSVTLRLRAHGTGLLSRLGLEQPLMRCLRWLLVQDLPGMVEGVPGGAAGDEPGRATLAGKLFGRAGGGAPDLRENPGPDPLDGGHILRREGPLLEPEHARVENLGFPHVGHDLVAIPATAARALAQHGWRD